MNSPSLEFTFRSFINFSDAVSSPRLLPLPSDNWLCPNCELSSSCTFELSSIWHFPIFTLGCGRTIKNSFFFTFSINKFIKSFWMFSTKQPTLYFPSSSFPTKYSEIGFRSKFSDTVRMVAAFHFDDLIGGIRMFCDMMYENSSVWSNSKIRSIESVFTLKG